MARPCLDLRTLVYRDIKGLFRIKSTLIKCIQDTLCIVLFSRTITGHITFKGGKKSLIIEILPKVRTGQT